MGLNSDLRALAGQFERLISQLPEDVDVKRITSDTPQFTLTNEQKAILASAATAFGESLSVEQQIWISREDNLRKIEQFMKTVQGKTMIAALVAQLQLFIR